MSFPVLGRRSTALHTARHLGTLFGQLFLCGGAVSAACVTVMARAANTATVQRVQTVMVAISGCVAFGTVTAMSAGRWCGRNLAEEAHVSVEVRARCWHVK